MIAKNWNDLQSRQMPAPPEVGGRPGRLLDTPK